MNQVKMKHYLFFRKLPPEDTYGGLEKLSIDLLKEVDFKEIKVSLAMPNENNGMYLKMIQKYNFPLEIYEFKRELNNNLLKGFIKTFIFLCRIKPTNIVYLQGGFYDFNLGEVLAGYIFTKGNVWMYESAGAPIPPITKRSLYFGFIPGLKLWFYKENLLYILRSHLAKKTVAISNEVKEILVKFYNYPEKKISVCYHGVDVKKFSPDLAVRQAVRKKIGIPQDHIVVISTARLATVKALHRLINAFDNIASDMQNSWLLIIGDGPLRPVLEALVDSKLSKTRICFLGFKEEVSDYLKMSDIYVLSSDNEGLGIAMLEAMSTGLISIATKVPGANEVIKDGSNGFLVERNEQGVKNGLMKAFSLSPEKRKLISANARKLIVEKFDLEKRVSDKLNILGIHQ